MPNSISGKMGLKPGMRAYFYRAPVDALSAIDSADLSVSKEARGLFDYIHLFVKSTAELDTEFPRLKEHLSPSGRLFVSWPKSRQLGSDLTLPEVIRIGYSHGLVESTALSINSVWSALKFTWPKPGKLYQNSYGTLPGAP
jgi:hypothetical protein